MSEMLRATVEMHPLELATLCHTARLCGGSLRSTKRTVRMRVHDFQPLRVPRSEPETGTSARTRTLPIFTLVAAWLGLGIALGHLMLA